MKIVFLGTPNFGRTILDALCKEHEVVLVVTQPDKLVGRKKLIEFSPVKQYALEHNLKVFQPENIRLEYQYIIDNYDFDLIVSAAYGQIVGTRFLYYPKYKAINVHGSLLPKGRGGAPIQRSIMNGEKETGITIMYMAKGMDSGDILVQESLAIEDNDTTTTLFNKMADLGAKMINPLIKELEKGNVKPIKQNEEEVTFTYALTKEDEELDFNKSAFLVNAQIRALDTIGCFFKVKGMMYKVYSASLDDDKEYSGSIGEIIEVNKKSFKVLCADKKVITIYEFKPEGKNLMKVADYLNGSGKNIITKSTVINM